MQNAWEKNDTWYGEEKMQVPYHDGYTAHTYHMPNTMSPTTGRKSMGDGSNSIHGSASQLGYTPLSFGSQTVIIANEATADTKPSFARLCLRIWQVISSIGTFVFQASAPAVAKKSFPYEPALLYFVYGVTCVSIMWNSFLIYVYLTRRYGNGGKIKRAVLCVGDAFLTICLGVGVFFEISNYPCPPGTQNGMCDMFNTGTFFGVTLFTVSAIATLWDIFGSLHMIRN